ncbi:hypothetical protein J3R30DRAFT_3776711 [Lentinula aciculospora]|uniref:Uncharacterized protein n=1 Tax=Lentinula aciculospora TaxID=153920 RepID=A0A9W9A5K8_9AGAR|nr:hypothetical protein J3R30DRAFT_3776711 [Lentinula aciculospora]
MSQRGDDGDGTEWRLRQKWADTGPNNNVILIVILAGSASTTSTDTTAPSPPTQAIDCSTYLHTFDTKDQTHIHSKNSNSWANCSSQPCPNIIANSISKEENLSDSTVITLILTPTPPAMSNPEINTNQLLAQLIKQVTQLTANFHKASAKSSMNKPELFKGSSSAEACHFIAQYQSWAMEQPDLNNNEGKLIKAALGFFSGNVW